MAKKPQTPKNMKKKQEKKLDNEENEDIKIEEEDEEVEEVDISDVSLEEIMKNPDQFTDETDVVESTDWCPNCSDYTLFVNKVCTTCGYTKTSKKAEEKDDEDVSKTKLDYLGADEDLDELKYGYDSDDDDYKYD